MLRLDVSKPLFKAMHHQSSIEIIDLSNNFLEDESLRYLADGLATLNKVKSLKLSGNFITHHGISSLIQKLVSSADSVLPQLDLLDLSHNPLGAEGIARLSALVEHCPALRSLHLGSVDATHLNGLNLSGLTVLNISHNQFEVSELRKLLRTLNACKMSVLNLGFCLNAGGEAVRVLAEWLQSGTLADLKELNLNGWHLDDSDIFELVQTLRRAKSLDAVYLMDNPQMGTIGLMQLVQHLRVDRLYLDGCPDVGRNLATTMDTIGDHQMRSECKWIRVTVDKGKPDIVDVWKQFWTRLHGNAAAHPEVCRRQLVLKLLEQ